MEAQLRQGRRSVAPSTRTSRTHISSHASGAVISRVSCDAKVEFLLIPYMILGQTTWKFVMGRQEARDESPRRTLLREVEQEAIDPASGFECQLYDEPVILTELVPDQSEPHGYHLKIFQLAALLRGKLREKDIVDDTGESPERLGPPQWIEASTALYHLISDPATKPVHLKALKAGMISLAMRDPKIASRYSRTMDACCSDFTPEEPEPIVLEYLRNFGEI